MSKKQSSPIPALFAVEQQFPDGTGRVVLLGDEARVDGWLIAWGTLHKNALAATTPVKRQLTWELGDVVPVTTPNLVPGKEV